MNVKLKAKTILLQGLEKLPSGLGDGIYHFIQDKLSGKSLSQKIKTSYNSYKTLERLAEKSEISMGGKTILEIGSGWLPLMPYFFCYFANAKKVITYDLNEHYNSRNINKLNHLFSEIYELEVKDETGSKYPLPAGINYFPRTNLIEHKISANVIFSRFVMEHVHPEDIWGMHQKFKDELSPGSYIIHFISPSDHRAYIDNSLSLQAFLHYSQEEWDSIQTRFDYHNRWRLPQYIELFEGLGFEIVHLEYESLIVDSVGFKRFKKVKIHSDFKGYSNEELTAGAINVVLKT